MLLSASIKKVLAGINKEVNSRLVDENSFFIDLSSIR
jgi:hypothetical protein